jgi:hypothetical protein
MREGCDVPSTKTVDGPGDVPLTVETEVATPLAPRGSSGCFTQGSRHDEACQEERIE